MSYRSFVLGVYSIADLTGVGAFVFVSRMLDDQSLAVVVLYDALCGLDTSTILLPYYLGQRPGEFERS